MTLTQYIGDSVTHRLPLRWGKMAFTPGNTWGLIFTVKANAADTDAARKFQKITGTGVTHSGSHALVEVLPVDTAGDGNEVQALTPGTYYCDVQAQHLVDGTVQTVWEGTLVLRRDITRSVQATGPIYTSEEPVFQGIQGIQGIQGEQGLQGIPGEQGIQGPAGDGASDVSDLTTTALTEGNMLRVAAGGGLEQRTPGEVLADIGAAGASHPHVSADITDAATTNTPGTLVLRGANGEAEFGDGGNGFGGNGVYAYSDSGTGVNANSDSGTGVAAYSDSGTAVNANSSSGTAVNAYSNTGNGVIANSNSGNGLDAYSNSGIGVNAVSYSGTGVSAYSNTGNGLDATSETGTGVNATSETGTGVNAYSETGTGVYAYSDYGNGVIATSSSGTGVNANSDTGTNHAEFGYDGANRSFVRRVLGLFGWWRRDVGDTTDFSQTFGSPANLTQDSDIRLPDVASGTVALTSDLEGANIKSTGEAGGTKYLREDGDGTCSWQTVAGGGGDLTSGPVTSSGGMSAIANGEISNAMLANGAVANLSGTNTGDETDARIATIISATTADTTLVDADVVPVLDSTASFGLKKFTLTSLKTWVLGFAAWRLSYQTANFTAVAGGRYVTAGTGIVVTDPTSPAPVAGDSFMVRCASGTVVIGGSTFAASRFDISRFFNGSVWSTAGATVSDTLTVGSNTWSGSTITGEQAFSSTTRPTSAGTGTPQPTSLVTLGDCIAQGSTWVSAMLGSTENGPTNSTAYQSSTTLTIPLSVGTWEITTNVMVDAGSSFSAAGAKVKLAFSGTATFSGMCYRRSNAGATSVPSSLRDLGQTMTGVYSETNQSVTITREGTAVVTVAGSLAVEFGAVNAVAASFPTLPPGCYIRARRTS